MSQLANPHGAPPTAEHRELYTRLDAGAVVEAAKVREGALCRGKTTSGASSSADYWATTAERLLDVFG